MLYGGISQNNIAKPFPWNNVLSTALSIGQNLGANNYANQDDYEFKPSNYYYDDDFTHKYINGDYRDLNSKIIETQNYQYQQPRYTNPITDTQQQAIFALDRDSFFEKFRKGLELEAQKLTRRLPDPINDYYFGQINNEYLNNSNNIPNGPILHYVSQHHPTPHKQKIYDYYTRPYSLRTPKDSELFQYALQLSNHLDNSDKYANAGYNYIKNLSAASPKYYQGFTPLIDLAQRAAAIKRQQAGALNLPDLSGFAAQNQNSEPMAEFKRLYEYYLDTQKKKIQAQNQLNQLVAQKNNNPKHYLKPEVKKDDISKSGNDKELDKDTKQMINDAAFAMQIAQEIISSPYYEDAIGLFKNGSDWKNDLTEYYKRHERKGLIIKYKDKIKEEAKKNGIYPEMIAGVLLNETPRPVVDKGFEMLSKGLFQFNNFMKYDIYHNPKNYKEAIEKAIKEKDAKVKAAKGKTAKEKAANEKINIIDNKYPTVGIAQVSPISAIVEEILKFAPINSTKLNDKKTEYTFDMSLPELEKEREKMSKNLQNNEYAIAYLAKILKKLKTFKHLGSKNTLTDDEMATIVGEYNTNEGTKYGDSFKYNLEYIRHLLK